MYHRNRARRCSDRHVTNASDSLPDDIATLKTMAVAAQAARIEAEAKAARAAANVCSAEALIAHVKLAIEKPKPKLYGSRSEPTRMLLDQMELELGELEAQATEDEIKAETAAKLGGITLVPPICAGSR
jgi:transposase